MAMIYIDADDFHETNHSLDVLQKIHDANGMKFNLFTVIGRCSQPFIEEVRAIPWIDMIPHGWNHDTDRECEHWDRITSLTYIGSFTAMWFTKGWKSPGWRTSQALYRALIDCGYWICDHHDNDHLRPAELPVFHIPPEHHFHIGGSMGNRIDNHVDRLMEMQGPFGFIKDLFV